MPLISFAPLIIIILSPSRVEGTGNAVITDVIYSSKTISEEEQTATGSKEEYERMKVWSCNFYCVVYMWQSQVESEHYSIAYN